MGYKENFSAYSLGGNCPKSISFLGRSDLIASRENVDPDPQEGKRIPFGTNAL